MVRGYVICAEPRSGTNYLARLLQATGVLGRPWEWFHRPAILASGLPDWPSDPEQQLAQIPVAGGTSNGVYGLKMFSEHVDRVAAIAWAERLPELKFIHLMRRDLLGQAISMVRAQQSQEWTKGGSPHDREHRPAPRPLTYDGAAIRAQLEAFASGDRRWRLYFARNGIEPLRLEYEFVCDFPRTAVKWVADLVDLPEPEISWPKVDVQIQRDMLTSEWRARFVEEAYNVNRL